MSGGGTGSSGGCRGGARLVNTGRDGAKPETAAEAFSENVHPVGADVADVRQIVQLFGAISANTDIPR
jgi:hypothetical protein